MSRAEPVAGGSMTTIDPTSIPVFDGDLTAVAAAATRFTKAGTQVERAGVRVHTRFQGLDGCYRAPESADLLASTVPVRTRATEFGEHLTAVGRALATYVYQMRSVASRLDAVQSEACAFVVEQLPNGENWDKDPAAVAKNNTLLATVNGLVVAKAAVERDCANAINRIIGGPTWHASGQGTGPFQYGPGAIPPTMPTPWGRPVSPDLPWWRDAWRWIRAGVDVSWHASKSYAYGFFVDGLVGTIDGLRILSFNLVVLAMAKELTGRGSSSDTRSAALESALAWRQLAMTAAGVAVLGNPVLLTLAVAMLAHPKYRGWARTMSDPTLQTAKGFLAWDTWRHDPARALGATAFNVVTFVLPTKGISSLGKGTGGVDDAARAASATEHTAEVTSRAAPVPRSAIQPRTPPSAAETAAARSGLDHLSDPPPSGTPAAGAYPTVEALERALPTRDTVRRGAPQVDEPAGPSTRHLPDGEPANGSRIPDTSTASPRNRPSAPHPSTHLPDDAATRRPGAHVPDRPAQLPDPASRVSHDVSRAPAELGARSRPGAGDEPTEVSRASGKEPGPGPRPGEGDEVAAAARARGTEPDPRIRPAVDDHAAAGSRATEPFREPGTEPSAASRASNALSDSGQGGRPSAQSPRAVPEAQLPKGSGAVEPPRRLPDLEPRQLPRPVTGDPAPGHPYLPAAEPRPPARGRVPESHSRLPDAESPPRPGDRAPGRHPLPDQESRQLSRRGAGESPPDRPHPPATDKPPSGDDIHPRHADAPEDPHQPRQGPDTPARDRAEGATHDITWNDVADDLPTDRSGYHLRPRDCDYLGITPEQVHWWKTRQAPLGMNPQQYGTFRTTLREALEADGVDLADVNIRLQGSAARFFSGAHKHFPMPGRKGWTPQVAERITEWFGDDPARPASRPFDSGHELGIDNKLSDYDVQISSDRMVVSAHERWLWDGRGRPFIRERYGFVDRGVFGRTFPELRRWRGRWERKLGRQVPPALFPSSGPPSVSRTGLSAAFREDDWVIDLRNGDS